MSADTQISWATKTWNPTVGCEHVSAGCDNCYAKTLHDMRHAAFQRGKLQNIPQYAKPFEEVQTIPDRLADPLGWREPQRIFVNSVSDVFHKDVPLAFVDRIMITIAQAPRHTFMILTKRPARMRAYSQEIAKLDRQQRGARMALSQYAGTWMEKFVREDMPGGMDWPLPNLIFGVSTENQATADQRIPMLIDTPAALRFVSCEPLLGPIDLQKAFAIAPADEGFCRPGQKLCADPVCRRGSKHFAYEWGCRWSAVDNLGAPRNVDWIIVGGESGKNARPMHPDWARALRDQCQRANVAFHFKQWGEHAPVPFDDDNPNIVVHATPKGRWLNLAGGHGFHDDEVVRVDRVGAKRAGRELDGRTWDEFPTITKAVA